MLEFEGLCGQNIKKGITINYPGGYEAWQDCGGDKGSWLRFDVGLE